MSKKAVKQTVKIEPGMACVIASVDDLIHIRDLYKYSGDICKDKVERDGWYRISELIDFWINQTAVEEVIDINEQIG